jgi:hypothetical protein
MQAERIGSPEISRTARQDIERLDPRGRIAAALSDAGAMRRRSGIARALQAAGSLNSTWQAAGKPGVDLFLVVAGILVTLAFCQSIFFVVGLGLIAWGLSRSRPGN